MKRSLSLLPLLALAAATGCAGPSSYVVPAGSYRSGPRRHDERRAVGLRALPAQPVSSASVTAESSSPGRALSDGDGPRAQPSSPPAELPSSLRPGLATHWGEDRYSTVRTTAFERASERPFDVATLHYNDARLSAMQALRESFRWLSVHRDGIRISLRVSPARCSRAS